MFNVHRARNLDNLRKVYLTIKNKTSEILLKYDDVDYLVDPSIDIMAIAKALGIAEIRFVPPEEIHFYHATLEEIEKDKFVIKVNEKDSKEEQLFSIAHEIEHHLKNKADMLRNADVFKPADYEKKYNALKKADIFKNPDELAARYSISNNHKKAVRKLKRMKGCKPVASFLAETVTENLGKAVSIKQAYNELAKVFTENKLKSKIRKGSNEKFVLSVINELYDEEMADYFAANLLVPTERFLLWKNKSDKKIAATFKVSKSCIKKRREEIKHELDFITSKNIQSGDL